MHRDEQHPRTPVERVVGRGLDEHAGLGRSLSDRARQSQRSVESYLKGGGVPRWMERSGEIDAGVARHRKRLARTYRALWQECEGDRVAFERRWRAVAERWSFGELNDLIDQHNQWYPVERQLPLNPRTGEYVLVGGRSYRRPSLDAGWILEQFPAPGPA
jgi:hypothetical protein